MHALVGGGEGVVGGQHGLPVAAGEVDRAPVAGGDVAVGSRAVTVMVPATPAVVDEGKPVTLNVAAGSAAGIDRDARLRAGDAAGRRVRGGQRLRAGRIERGAEGMHAGVGGGEGVVAGQRGAAVGAGEVDRADVAGGHVAVGVAWP